MAEYPYFYNSDNHDRVYDAGSFEEWLRYFFTTGVFIDTCFVKETSGLNVILNSGYCNIRGKVMIWESATTLKIDIPHSYYDRIDNIVIERNDIDRDFYRKVVTGTPAANPVPPEPVRENGIYQLVVGRVRVAAGATAITQSSITDTRPDTNLCGYVAGTVKEMDFSQFTAQFQRYVEEFKAGNEADFERFREQFERDFLDYAGDQKDEMREWYRQMMADINAWYDSIKDKISSADAGRLQMEIDELRDTLNTASDFKMPIKTTTGDIIKTASNAILVAHDGLVRMSQLNNILHEFKKELMYEL